MQDHLAVRPYKAMRTVTGSHGGYFPALLEIVEWVAAHPSSSRDEIYAWFLHNCHLSPESPEPKASIGVVTRMGYLIFHGDQVALTSRGWRLAETKERYLVLGYLLRECVAMYDILHMVQTLGTTDEKVLWARLNGRYPFWTKTYQYSFRLRWLLSLGAVAEAGKRYTITPIGAQALQQFAGQQPNAAAADEGEDADDAEHESNTSDEMSIEATPATTPSVIELEGRVSEASSASEAESIVASILAAAHDSSNPTRFELTLVDAFRFLGFEAEHKSGAGDTDVLVRAPLGKEHYRAVVDAKASHKNTSGHINWSALVKHKKLYNADYILVVAPGFSSGDVRKYAEEIGAALLSAEDLSSIVSQHVVTPLSLDDLRALFTSPGDPTSPLRHISERAKQIQHAHQLLSDVIRTFVDGQQSGMFELTVDVVQFGLSRDYQHTVYTKEEIASVLDMLCIPVLGALRRDGPDIFCLRMSPLTIVRRLQAMASILTSAMEQEHWPANVPQASHVRRR